jgi:hypothetical protein
MRPTSFMTGVVALVAAAWLWGSLPAAAQQARPAPPRGPLKTLADIERALRDCWEWPAASAIKTGMELTVRLSFKRSGEIFGAHITYQSRNVSPEERDLYYRAMVRSIGRCSPLPVSPSLGQAIAGRPFFFHFEDHRKQRKASLDG